MTAQPEEKLGIVWMRPGQEPVYFQLPMALALKKMAQALRHSTLLFDSAEEEYASVALRGLLQNKKNNR